jgi:hypothetical protein
MSDQMKAACIIQQFRPKAKTRQSKKIHSRLKGEHNNGMRTGLYTTHQNDDKSPIRDIMNQSIIQHNDSGKMENRGAKGDRIQ